VQPSIQLVFEYWKLRQVSGRPAKKHPVLREIRVHSPRIERVDVATIAWSEGYGGCNGPRYLGLVRWAEPRPERQHSKLSVVLVYHDRVGDTLHPKKLESDVYPPALILLFCQKLRADVIVPLSLFRRVRARNPTAVAVCRPAQGSRAG